MDPRSSRGRVRDPPSYGSAGGSSVNPGSRLSAQGGLTEHVYSLTTSKDVPWVKLKVNSRARSPSHLPSFFEGEGVSGVVQLSLEREDSLKAISVTVGTHSFFSCACQQGA